MYVVLGFLVFGVPYRGSVCIRDWLNCVSVLRLVRCHALVFSFFCVFAYLSGVRIKVGIT